MRRWPLKTTALALFLFLLSLKSPLRDALEVSVQAAGSRVRNLLGGESRSGEAPGLRPDVKAFLERERTVSSGGREGAWIVQVIPGEDRFHVVVDRGRGTGIRPGDLALFFTRPDGPACLAGEVDGLSESFARIRTFQDHETWWKARTPSSRMVLVKEEEAAGLRVVLPEDPQSLKEDEGKAACTVEDRQAGRRVPEGIVIGTLRNRSGPDSPDWWVEPVFDPRRVLGVRLVRGSRGRVGEAGKGGGDRTGRWWPVRVIHGRDSNPIRASALVSRVIHTLAIPVDAPVARGDHLEGWVHTVAGADARVRLVGDPGFYSHVLVLRGEGDRMTSPGGGVFRGRHRSGSELHGVLGKTRVPPEPGDRLVVGPHKGAGGIGLLIGEVVACGKGGALVLRRPPPPRRGDTLHVGVFPRPPHSFSARGGSMP